MDAKFIFPGLFQGDEPKRIQKVKYIGRGTRQHRDAAIYDIILRLFHKKKHEDQRHGLHHNVAYRNICILFQCIIKPCDREHIQHHTDAVDNIQLLLRGEFRDHRHCNDEGYTGDEHGY